MNIDRINTLLSDSDIDSDVFERLLEGGANFNVRDGKGSTPLHILCLRGKLNFIEMLLEKSMNGVSLDTKNDAGRTALANAVFNNRTDVVRVLLQHGADPSIADKGGTTPLAIASVDKQSEIMKMLLQHPASRAQAERPLRESPYQPDQGKGKERALPSRSASPALGQPGPSGTSDSIPAPRYANQRVWRNEEIPAPVAPNPREAAIRRREADDVVARQRRDLELREAALRQREADDVVARQPRDLELREAVIRQRGANDAVVRQRKVVDEPRPRRSNQAGIPAKISTGHPLRKLPRRVAPAPALRENLAYNAESDEESRPGPSTRRRQARVPAETGPSRSTPAAPKANQRIRRDKVQPSASGSTPAPSTTRAPSTSASTYRPRSTTVASSSYTPPAPTPSYDPASRVPAVGIFHPNWPRELERAIDDELSRIGKKHKI